MKTAKIFKNGRSQAVRLPKEFRFDDSDIYIKKFEDFVLLIPNKNLWGFLHKGIEKFTDDYMEDYSDLENQERKKI